MGILMPPKIGAMGASRKGSSSLAGEEKFDSHLMRDGCVEQGEICGKKTRKIGATMFSNPVHASLANACCYILYERDLLESPLVLSAHLLFLLRGEIIFNIESSANLIWRLPLDHVGHSVAGEVEQGLHVEVVGSQDEFKKSTLIHFAELRVPSFQLVIDLGIFASVVLVLLFLGLGLDVLSAVLDHFCQDASANIRQGDILALTDIYKGTEQAKK